MWRILLNEFWEDLQTQRTRVLLTAVGIACGTFIVVVLVALGEGIKRAVMTELLSAYDDAIVVYAGATSMPYRGLPPRRRITFEVDDVPALIREVPDIDAASAVYDRWDVRLTVDARHESEESQVMGVDAAYSRIKDMTAAPGGRFLNARDIDERRRVVFLADSLARILFPTGDALGNSVRLNNQLFTVIGIAPRRVQTGIESTNPILAMIPSTTYTAVYNERAPSELILRARNPRESTAVQEGVRRVLADRHRFDIEDRSAIYLQDWAEDARTMWRITTGIQVFMGMVGGLTLLVAAVGVANIMYVAVKERTLEVGIKLALGARSRHIIAQFVFEAMMLCVAGGIAGLAAAGVAVAVINGVDTENRALVYMLRPVISWQIGVATVLILTVVGFMAGVFPARRAASLDPVESLRYE